MADAIKVDAEGLHAHAAVCNTASAPTTPTAGGPVYQALTAAVAQGNALVQSAAATFAGRATSTSDQLHAAVGNYTTTDGGSAQAMTTTIEV
ncbi:hypothetical protein D2E70_16195 [Mycobacteroides abscessus]|uniref:hypothetical protein n=1 Tax=Mycobacteroides abscessus TaxID=36809 RepID=UPI000C2680CF|nr:hypothetical protein [Mycobacteroides abscessus]RIS67513.1 hypothetical protein D2E70_16195 [Mycobacteroides abscessus]